VGIRYERRKDDDDNKNTADPWHVFGLGFGAPISSSEPPRISLTGNTGDTEVTMLMEDPAPSLLTESATTADVKYMRRCIDLALCGKYHAAPNPMVGAVIVAPDGRIIGEGYHVRCGEGHAEVNAFASVKPEDEHLLSESTIYVSLEPCAHYGKTPPCADLIVRKHIKRCVVGCIDPFAKVQGRGIEILRTAGISVTVGVLEKECQWLNRRFFTYHQKHRPYITLKWAQTADQVIGVSDDRLLISNSHTQMLCHKLRSESHAILVGRGTAEADQPSLNVRCWSGPSPRIFILSHATGTIETLLRQMYDEGIQTLLVEGGSTTLQSFIDFGLWDEAHVETSPKTRLQLTSSTGEIVKAPILNNALLINKKTVCGHKIETYINKNNQK